MRKETRKYLCAELRDYQLSLDELRRMREKMSMLKFPAFRKQYGIEKIAYMQTRVSVLSEVVTAIDELWKDLPEEDKKILKLKFWSRRPRMTDNQIATVMNLSRSQYYRRLNNICLMLGRKLGTDL